MGPKQADGATFPSQARGWANWPQGSAQRAVSLKEGAAVLCEEAWLSTVLPPEGHHWGPASGSPEPDGLGRTSVLNMNFMSTMLFRSYNH